MSKSKDVAKNYQQVSLFQREEGKKLIDDVEIHRGHVILDLSCGTGELSAYLSELVRQDGRVVAKLFYTGTFPYACTASTIPSFLLFIQNINIMIYFYLCVFNNNGSNPSFCEEQLSATGARNGFGWISFTHRLVVNK